MRQNSYNVVAFVLLAGLTTALWWYAERNWFPKADRPKELPKAAADAPPKASPEAVAALTGAAASTPAPPRPKPDPKPEPKPAPPAEPPTLTALGGDDGYLRVLLSSRGGGVQQVVLTRFEEADRLGRKAVYEGKAVPLYLIPGVRQVRGGRLDAEFVPPDLKPGKVVDPDTLARMVEPSYTLFHYPTPDDKYPSDLLGTVNWVKVVDERAADGTHKVVFETDALKDAPHFLKVRKTFTLGPKDYHLGLAVEFERLPGGQKGKAPLRYQVSGPRGEPVEGEWYTSTTRTCLIGWLNARGTAKRQYEDAASITAWRGGAEVPRSDGTFQYAAIATQYFTSALAIADPPDQARTRWAYVRGTSELPFLKSDEQIKAWEAQAKDEADPAAAVAAKVELARARELRERKQPELDDITFRAVSEPVDLGPGETAAHAYAVYNGPTKVGLLGYLSDDDRGAVDPALVETYRKAYGLKTLTDYHSPTWIGAFLNAIYWSDTVIFFTNVMHWLLWAIHALIGSWGFSIVVLTLMIRLTLLVFERKQTAMSMRMAEMQKRLKPEVDKLQEKYKDDYQAFNREKTRLMLQHGALNPFAAMGGCLLLLAQSPIIMGLYFCLQESVFFRLEPFLGWIQNLAAPDMTLWWGEGIPVISDPDARQGFLGFLYLGPFLNVLPLVAVGLMLYQQHKMMPPAMDEQAAAQQRMMKWMMAIMAVMFYRVAAGLALYFILGTGWSLSVRQFIPKPKLKEEDLGGPAAKPGPPKRKGRFGRMMERVRERLEEAQRQAEEQSSRQIKNSDRKEPIRNPERRTDTPNGPPNGTPPDRRDRDRKKKRRK